MISLIVRDVGQVSRVNGVWIVSTVCPVLSVRSVQIVSVAMDVPNVWNARCVRIL